MLYSRAWGRDTALKCANIINEDSSEFSMLFPVPYSCHTIKYDELFKVLQKGIETNFKDMEVVDVGRITKEVETFASMAPMGAIGWWPMEPKDSLEMCIKYAKFCSSCKEKVVMLPELIQK